MIFSYIVPFSELWALVEYEWISDDEDEVDDNESGAGAIFTCGNAV